MILFGELFLRSLLLCADDHDIDSTKDVMLSREHDLFWCTALFVVENGLDEMDRIAILGDRRDIRLRYTYKSVDQNPAFY